MVAMSPRFRRPGSPWRLLVHEAGPAGVAHHVTDEAGVVGGIMLPATEFDELVVGRWLHTENMDSGRWWMNVGGVTVWIDVDRAGRARNVEVTGPAVTGAGEPDCAYRVAWNDLTTGSSPSATA
jgi:hypothetical protein